MTTILCIPSPPFGAFFWTAVCKRLEDHHQPTKIVTPLLDAENLAQATRLLDDELSSIDDSIILLTHGATLNLGLALATHPKVRGIVLTNGSVSKPSILAQLGSNIPTSLLKIALSPRISTSIFSSSLGMRRWVVNPYVMNRDMVVRVCQEFLENRTYRNNALKWVGNNATPLSEAKQIETPCLSIWGTHDFFHPISERQQLDKILTQHTAIDVPGGRYLHALERPWETADALLQWMRQLSL